LVVLRAQSVPPSPRREHNRETSSVEPVVMARWTKDEEAEMSMTNGTFSTAARRVANPPGGAAISKNQRVSLERLLRHGVVRLAQRRAKLTQGLCA
jgi:hypothetical protein